MGVDNVIIFDYSMCGEMRSISWSLGCHWSVSTNTSICEIATTSLWVTQHWEGRSHDCSIPGRIQKIMDILKSICDLVSHRDQLEIILDGLSTEYQGLTSII